MHKNCSNYQGLSKQKLSQRQSNQIKILIQILILKKNYHQLVNNQITLREEVWIQAELILFVLFFITSREKLDHSFEGY